MADRAESDGADVFLQSPLEDEASYRREFPAAWHGGPSRAECVLAGLSISASRFMAANPEDRQLALEAVASAETRRLLGRSALYVVIALGFLMVLSEMWLIVAVGGVALKAGADLGRYTARMRQLAAARELTEDDLEVRQPGGGGS